MRQKLDRCIVCGARVPMHLRRCPECGRELLDRNAWYNKYASNIVGAVLGAGCGAFWVIAGLVLWPEWFDVPFVSKYVGAIVLGGALLGLAAGFFEWDSMRGADRDGFFLKMRKWQRTGSVDRRVSGATASSVLVRGAQTRFPRRRGE